MKFRRQREITFEEFYNETHKLLLYMANRLLHNQHDAEEIVQDVYCKVAGDFEKYYMLSHEELRKIACTITKNNCINLLKKKEIHNEFLCEINDELLGDTDCVQDEIFKQYQKEYIKEALGRLKKSDVDILILKYYDELSYADIAKSLSTTEKNVEVKLRRARHRLKEVLEDEY